MHLIRSIALTVGLVAACSLAASGQGQRTLSIESIYDPARRVDFSGAAPPETQWLDSSSYLIARRVASGTQLLRVDVALWPATYVLGVSWRIAARDSINW